MLQNYRIPFPAMGSTCELVLAVESEERAHVLARAAIAEVQRIEHKYSRYRTDSVVSRINAAAGSDAVGCDAETWSLLTYANSLYQASDGLFDITSGVLRKVWNFKEPALPDTAELARICALVNWPAVEMQDQTIRLPRAGMEIDFGGFGKEYAADRAGAALASLGLTHGYVNLAGDMVVLGPKPDGQAWQMGIQDPRRKDQIVASIPLQQGGLATSGDYERFFELDGRRYCHILDPRTGMPVQHWRTISVTAPLALTAGTCTTIAMLKQSAAIEFLEASGLDYLAVDQQGTIFQRQMPAG